MNDYGFDYMNYINNITSNMMDMNKFNMNQKKKTNQNNQITEPYDGLIKGNMFSNLYDPYKNYRPKELESNTEREALLYQVMQYKFALIELNLYLDTNPNDKNALELFNKYSDIEKKICKKYESMYGPLVIDSENQNEYSWQWNKSPWPWEVM